MSMQNNLRPPEHLDLNLQRPPATQSQPVPNPQPVSQSVPTTRLQPIPQSQQMSKTQPIPQSQQMPQPMPPSKPPKAKKGPGLILRIILRCISVFLSILLFFALCGGILIYDGIHLFSADYLEELLDNLESGDYENSEILLMMQDEMVYWVDTILETEYSGHIQLEREQIVAFLSKSSINDFLAQKASGYVRDILEGTRKTKVSNRELESLYQNNKQLMEDELGISISDEMDRQIQENLQQINVDAMVQEKVFDYLESDNGPTTQLQEALHMISTVFSESSLAICCGIISVLMIALFLCNRLKPVGSLTHCGIPMVLAGLLMILPVLLAGPVFMEFFASLGGNMPSETNQVLTLLLIKCRPMLTVAPLVVLITGGVFILAATTVVTVKLFLKKK